MYFLYTVDHGFEFTVYRTKLEAEVDACELRELAAYRNSDVIVTFIAPSQLAKHVIKDLD